MGLVHIVLCLALSISIDKAAGSMIAFSVAKTAHQRVEGAGNITFDHIFVNVGDAYSTQTSRFTAPFPGVYAFHAHALTGDYNKRFVMAIYKNEERTVSAYGSDVRRWSMGGNTVLLQLDRGDHVSVRFLYGSNDVWGGGDEYYVTFSGYLVLAGH